MAETARRLLRLLGLLQVQRDWTGPELAGRLEVSERTVRRDVDRLRELGYPIDARRGPVGGYRLAAGSAMPPLLLDDDEAVAIAVALSTTTRAAVTGMAESALRALAKLQQVMPPLLRAQVAALAETTVAIPPDFAVAEIDTETLSTLATAARSHQLARFDYTAHGGQATVRRTEPQRLVVWDRRWYLLAWDLDRHDWRRFRVDRIGHIRSPLGPRFTPREVPDDIATAVARDIATAGFGVTARVVVRAPASAVAARVPPAVGPIEALGPSSARLSTGAENVEVLALYLGMLGADFEVTGPPELIAQLRRLSERYARAADAAR
ncbi:helix-turn-helix transcriptional regulator [Gryllotalpicola ginsengisoli]|uniref:helix-turn-helix transcriptional regulator n=1 Tax=Gryllotalpicola ginsengisoli TaxID=444608 RepID=UPI0003B7AAB3|nr:YafY family protein [Gryllotalpicola ginsengisoli]